MESRSEELIQLTTLMYIGKVLADYVISIEGGPEAFLAYAKQVPDLQMEGTEPGTERDTLETASHNFDVMGERAQHAAEMFAALERARDLLNGGDGSMPVFDSPN